MGEPFRSLRLAALGGLVVMFGCDGDESRHSRALIALDTTRACTDSVESLAFMCSGQTARRSGDTLFVQLAASRETFVDDQTSEAPGGFHYVGRIGRARFHLIESYGHETAPVWIFINARTGHRIVAADRPIVSPDTERFASASDGWNNCTELDHPRMDVWRLTDTLPVLEWQLDPWNCKTQTGWGPTDPKWAGPDTLRFTRNDLEFRAPVAPDSSSQPIYHARPMLAVRERNGWRVTSQP